MAKRMRFLPASIALFSLLACVFSAPTPAATPAGPDETAATPSGEGPSATSWVYAVVFVPEGGVLEARTGAGYEHPVAGTVPWDFTPLTSTGNVSRVGMETWVEANLPGGGTGWFDRKYLTSFIPPAEFCSQFRNWDLPEQLLEALQAGDGRLLARIVSPVHGLTVEYINRGNPKVYPPERVAEIFDSPEVVDWGLGPGSGMPVRGTFAELVRPDLLGVFSSSYETHCNTVKLGGASYTVEWPSRWKNINFLSVHKPGSPDVEMDWMTWLVGIEGAEGEHYLFSLARYNWEP